MLHWLACIENRLHTSYKRYEQKMHLELAEARSACQVTSLRYIGDNFDLLVVIKPLHVASGLSLIFNFGMA